MKIPKLTEYDYGYLKGDKEMWPGWGAAFAVVMEFCEGCGYGEFGDPTGRGEKVMKEYENELEKN